MKHPPKVIIVGAGLSGLACAITLKEAEVPFLVLEAGNRAGGRVATDNYEDFNLDRGFQVLLTDYPEAKKFLDYKALQLHNFYPGALVRFGGAFHKLGDPFRHPLDVFPTLLNPVGNWQDKLLVAKLRQRLEHSSITSVLSRPETETLDLLSREGFSPKMIDEFFRPFFGGITLDDSLKTSSRFFDFVFKLFGSGNAAVPKDGMGAIPKQMASRLAPHTIRYNTTVHSIQDGIINLPHNETLGAEAIVVAADPPGAARLLGDAIEIPKSRNVTCMYYVAPKPPIDEPILMLNGEGKKDGPINNLAIMTNVCPAYATHGQSLISVSLLSHPEEDEMDLEAIVRTQLKEWFPTEAFKWRYLKTYKINYALPEQRAPHLSEIEKPVRLREGLYVCGDHRDTASINGALSSGRRAAEAIIADYV